MRFSISNLWSSPLPPNLVPDDSDTESDDESLATPTRVRQLPSRQVNYLRYEKPVRERTPDIGTYETEGIHFAEEHVTETLSKSEWLERERLVLAQKLKEVTETLDQVTKELQRSDRDLDEERTRHEATKAQFNRLNRDLREECWAHEATKAQLQEERRINETTKAQVDRLDRHLVAEHRAHEVTQAELDEVKSAYRRLQETTTSADESESNDTETDEYDELSPFVYNSANVVFSVKDRMGASRSQLFCLSGGVIYRAPPQFNVRLLDRPYVLYSGHARRVPQCTKVPKCKNTYHFFDMRGTNGYMRKYRCTQCGFFCEEREDR